MGNPFGPYDYETSVMDLDPRFAGYFNPALNYTPTHNQYSDLRSTGSSSGPPNVSPGMDDSLMPRTGTPPSYGSPFMPIASSMMGAGANQVANSVLSPASDSITGALPGVMETGGTGMGSYAVPGIGAALGAYGLYDTLTGDKTKAGGALQGAASGAALGGSIGSVFPGVGTAIGAGAGGLIGGAAGLLSGRDKPHPEQLDRQRALSQLGDMSKGLNSRAYNVANNRMDTTEGQTVGALNPLSAILTSRQGPEGFNNPDPNKRRSDLTGIMTNKALGGGNPVENITKMYADAGLTHNSAYEAIIGLRQSGQIADDATRDAYLAAIDKMYGVINPNAPKSQAPQAAPPTSYEMSARK